jgi:hypothetical protein
VFSDVLYNYSIWQVHWNHKRAFCGTVLQESFKGRLKTRIEVCWG